MQKFSFKYFLLTILLIFGFAVNAQAVFMLPYDTPIQFKFGGLEQIDTTVDVQGNPSNSLTIPGTNPLTGNTYSNDFGTMGNWGIFRLDTISEGDVSDPNNVITGGSNFWTDDTNHTQGQIHGLFGDIQLTSGTTANGGFLDLYWSDGSTDPIEAADMTGLYGPTAAVVEKFVQGDFLARLFFATGIIDGDGDTTVSSSIDLLGAVSGFKGDANSYADVDTSTPGYWTDLLNNDWFHVDIDGNGTAGEAGETRDVRFNNRFEDIANTAWDGDPGIFGASLEDPGTVFTAPIPEPGTMFLLGAGLLGFAGVVRRKSIG